ncbi:hypothetical protein AN218_04620 [Streptomyces nanshensis]|uniref:Uncharacterized protein n=2 Tax=Streptomyces nanshensis TaxID=518642 RepID=A0A1E7LAL8_9ACTN|nr:hypothetical protein AN218_04620 [Streptomyces nanshensis]
MYDDEAPIPATDEQGRYARITRAPGNGMPTYVVLIGPECGGTIFDEQFPDGTSLPRGRFAAWSPMKGQVGFFGELEAAADAIAETWPAPAGPKGTTEPKARADQANARCGGTLRRYNIVAEAARLHAEGGRTVAKAWKDALAADWKRQLAATPIPDEGELENCISVLGGEVHTAQWGNDEDMPTMPLCRTGAQDHMRTRYTVTPLAITCTTCIIQRENRAKRRAARG